MSYLRSLNSNAGLLEVFQASPQAARPLLEYHQLLLRDESPFTTGERELSRGKTLLRKRLLSKGEAPGNKVVSLESKISGDSHG